MNENAYGLLLGLVSGDRIGGPGQIALQLAESLQEKRCFDQHDIGSRYLQWWKNDGYDSGPTVAEVFIWLVVEKSIRMLWKRYIINQRG